MGSKRRTINEALRQAFELNVIKLAVGSPIRLWKNSDRALWWSWPPPKQKEEITDSLCAGIVGVLATFEGSAPRKPK
jgi:hypothetical protein